MSKRHGRGFTCEDCGSGPHPPTRAHQARKRKLGRFICDRCNRKAEQKANKKGEFKIR